MRADDRTRAFLGDILEAARRASAYVEGMSYEDFLRDEKTQDAVIRTLEIIGEAVKSIPEKVRAEAPQLPWSSIAGMRDTLIHHYFGVNLDIVWQVIQEDLPELVQVVKSLLASES